MKGRAGGSLASRIKKLMQADDEVGKIAQATPVLIGQAVELFLDQLCKGAGEVASARGDKMLGPGHLKVFVNDEPSMDFLRGIVQSAPDLVDKPTSPTQKRRNPAAASASSGGGRGRGRGRGRGERKPKTDVAAEASEPAEKRQKTVKDEEAPSSPLKPAAERKEEDAAEAAKVKPDEMQVPAAPGVEGADSAAAAPGGGGGGGDASMEPGHERAFPPEENPLKTLSEVLSKPPAPDDDEEDDYDAET